MFPMLRRIVLAVAAASALAALPGDASAGGYYRQYYTSWSYYSTTTYYYRTYYYYPTPTATTYSYHYCIYYPSQPRYVYYYNPVSHQYWGRFEFGTDGKAKGYSLLAEKDRKEKLADIPESAFPKPGAMPAIPGSSDNEKMDPPPTDLPLTDLPKD
jgi:hypothetical protein